MSRPALAALRGIRILDFLASFPDRRFSLTEIAGATAVNRASCLAILGELEQHGYLCRHSQRKTYWLGPALMAAGASAARANPLLARIRAAAARLQAELDVPVLLTTLIGDEILCLLSLPDDAARSAGLRVGDRVPLVPPIGASFVAWASPDQADAWIARRLATGPAEVAGLRNTLAVTRARGFHVTLRRARSEDIATVLARVAAGGEAPDVQRQVTAFVENLDVDAGQPDPLDDATAYDVQLIAAPVIDPEATRIYNLCLGGFNDRLSGSDIATLGTQLTGACLAIMQNKRPERF